MFRSCLSVIAACTLVCSTAYSIDPTEAAGEYTGPVYGETFADSGMFRLVLSKTGCGSFSLRTGGKAHVVKVRLDELVGGNLSVVGKGAAAINATLELTTGSNGVVYLEGDFNNGSSRYWASVSKAAANGGSTTGRHTFLVGGETRGVAVARVTKSGRTTGAAAIGSRRTAFGGRLSAHATLTLYAVTGLRSSFVGELTFGPAASSGAAIIHAAGAQVNALISGSPYHPDESPVPALSQLTIAVNGTERGTAITTSDGQIASGSLNGQSLRLSVAPASGIVKGSGLRGVVLQNIGAIAGHTANGETLTMCVGGSATDAQLKADSVYEAINKMVFGEPQAGGFVMGVVRGWAHEDPRAALEWLNGIQEPIPAEVLDRLRVRPDGGALGVRGDDGRRLRAPGEPTAPADEIAEPVPPDGNVIPVWVILEDQALRLPDAGAIGAIIRLRAPAPQQQPEVGEVPIVPADAPDAAVAFEEAAQ